MTLKEIILHLVMLVSAFNFGMSFYIVWAAFKSSSLIREIKEDLKKWNQ